MKILIGLPARNLMADALRTAVDAAGDGATIEMYGGEFPDTAESELGGAKPLAILKLAHPSAFDAETGIFNIPAENIVEDPEARDSADATWVRVVDAGGTTIICLDVTEMGKGGAVEMNTVNIAKGGPVRMRGMAITIPARGG